MAGSQAEVRKINIWRRVIFVLVALAVIIPCLLKIQLPGRPNHWAEKVYDQVETLKPGSHVLMSFDYGPSSQAELYAMSKPMLLHCFKKGVIPLLMTHDPTALDMMMGICQEAVAEAKARWHKDMVSGRDYVILGFRPGGAMLIVNMGENFKGAFDKDTEGIATADMPALKGVNSLKDINLGVDYASGGAPQMWIAYGADKFSFPLVVGTTAVQAPDMYIYLPSGQIKGLLGGLRGAADYETLMDMADKGPANKGMPPQSAVHVLLVLLILGANARMFYRRFRGKKV